MLSTGENVAQKIRRCKALLLFAVPASEDMASPYKEVKNQVAQKLGTTLERYQELRE